MRARDRSPVAHRGSVGTHCQSRRFTQQGMRFRPSRPGVRTDRTFDAWWRLRTTNLPHRRVIERRRVSRYSVEDRTPWRQNTKATLVQASDGPPALEIHARGLAVLDDPHAQPRDGVHDGGARPPRPARPAAARASRRSSSRSTAATSSSSPRQSDVEKWVFLTQLHDSNEVLFYRLVGDHVHEMLPIVYTPTVGAAIQEFSHLFRRPRGVFLNVEDVDGIERRWRPPGSDPTTSTSSSPPTPRRSSASATGASAGSTSRSASSPSTPSPPGSTPTGCWRSGSTSAPTASSCSTTRATSACAAPGSAARRTTRSSTPTWPAASARFPNAILHWEDFSGPPARGILARYGDTPVHLRRRHPGHGGRRAGLRAGRCPGLGRTADRPADRRLRRRLGRGRHRRPDRAGDDRGRPELPQEAADRIYLLDRPGLLTSDMTDLYDYQQPYAKDPAQSRTGAPRTAPSACQEVVDNLHPTMLVGTSGCHRCLRREGHPLDARPLCAADRAADVEPDRARGADAGEHPGLDRRCGAGRDRQPVRAGRARRHDVPHRPGEQRADVPRPRPRGDRVPRRDDAAVAVHRRGAGAGEAR